MLDTLKARIRQIKGVPAEAARRAAPLIEAKLRKDATTKRGNVPAYGDFGEVPIRAEVRPQAIVVTAPDFVIEKAQELGQVDAWIEIVKFEAGRALRGER